MKNSPELLNLMNIKEKFTDYLDLIKSLKHPMHQNDILEFMYRLKRDPLSSGPYPKVSLFETANRIFSDLVIFLGVKQLLTDPMVDNTRLPFTEYKVRFGVTAGHDLEADSGSVHLIGEAFHVASSLFTKKLADTEKKLQREKADYKLIIFNSDAAENRDNYLKKSAPSMFYLTVDVPKTLREIRDKVG
ncbi:MAG: hypothetical protein A2Y59_04185 [Chloroflexi bacterium RBG_13_52_14]|nr:MAG: hypothetical protein A2Y59_04185 [Chloroflexi bacterium RBG_13_52_14]